MKRVGLVVALALLGPGSALADFQSGLTAYNNKEFAVAVSSWTTEAAKGDLNSQYNLGILFEAGVEGFPKDLAAAYGWYRLAASQNVDAAKDALKRIKPLMTAGQIEEGNGYAVEWLGKWYRKNIGRNEQEHQAAKVALEKNRKAGIEAERVIATERAQRQRDLIAQRDADAKLADNLQKESRQAAIEAAQEKAEETKRRAFIEQRRKEEAARLAALKEEKDRQQKITTARSRLAELQAKQKSSPVIAPTVVPVAEPKTTQNTPVVVAPVVSEAPVAPVEKEVVAKPAAIAVLAPVKPKAPVVVAPKIETTAVPKEVVVAPKKVTVAEAKPKLATTKTVEPKAVAQQTPVAVTQPEKITKASIPVQKPAVPVVEVQKAEVKPTVEPVVKAEPVKAKAVEKPTVASRTPYKATVAPSAATIVAEPSSTKISLPVMTNGLDVAVMKQIVTTANSVSLDTPEAREDINSGRTDIQALQWSLISAARGKGSAKRMNEILEDKMTIIQIAEANRRAAVWIDKRQKRQ